ncbi:hypothetical protein AB0L06_43220 [Spirillospora sp. NPDC052269]
MAEDWSFASAREPAQFSMAGHRDSPEFDHAVATTGETFFCGLPKRATLCGIPEEELEVYLYLFEADADRACPQCRIRAVSAPNRPCGQERLHDLVLAAGPDTLRSRLLNALRTGAGIRIWVIGPANGVAAHAHLDLISEGRDALRPLLVGQSQVGVARVAQPGGEFVVVLPEDAEPVIARAGRAEQRRVGA